MHIRHFILIGATALFAVGCSKPSAHEAKLRQELSIPADMPMRDLGVVELSADTPKLVSLGVGRDLTVTASVITNGMLQMSLAYASKSETIDGRPAQAYSEHQSFMLPLGKQCAATFARTALGHLAVIIRPKLLTP
jgi:hypothetical protein